ncbi:class II aldolase like protein [Teratosphaeria destructans]|uniref:Class II aldolase like protein n=1 Tax=Teratosphaeria destructans TaxID=418781 RepID=A0A9W7SUC3_9PEZI|nr:class II aldolase like protein [Teratosphaeria destructans]
MADQRSALLRASRPPPRELFSTLITANHILHSQAVVDAYGHISVRNPQDPNTFFISKSLAPALVSRREDLEEYKVEDASPVNPNAPQGYLERFIHSEIYKKYKDVHAVVHAHSEVVLPFTITSQPLRPVFHMAATLGPQAPVYDISQHYKPTDAQHSLLVTAPHLGAALAAGFHPSTTLQKSTNLLKTFITSSPASAPDFPTHPVVLMRGHGFTAVGADIRDVVFRAVYTCVNARVQRDALLMQGTWNLGRGGGEGEKALQEVQYLSEREVRDARAGVGVSTGRPWGMWCAEVARGECYRNELEEGEDEGGGQEVASDERADEGP